MSMEFVGFTASFIMGITLGLMGGGGSILTVPILVYLLALAPTVATSYSLFIVGITALIGSLIYLRKGEVAFQTAFAFAVPSVVGVNVSRGVLLPRIPEVIAKFGDFSMTKEILIMVTFALLMVAAAHSMIRKRTNRNPIQANRHQQIPMIGVAGFIVGLTAGFVGAGGGFLIIPALVFMAGLSMRVAVGTSLFIIAFQSLLGFAGDFSRGLSIDWSLIGSVTGFAVAGILAGTAIAYRVQEQKIKSAFGWFVLMMGVTILAEQLSSMAQ